MRDIIIEKYLEIFREKPQKLVTIPYLCSKIPIQEKEFYDWFSSMEDLDTQVLADAMQKVAISIENTQEWAEYSARERLLAYYFTLFESFTNIRSFLVDKSINQVTWQKYLTPARKEAIRNFRKILAHGISSGEIQTRGLSADRYADSLWLAFRGLLQFWLKDSSLRFEKTDAAIEKTVHTLFDIMSRNFLDSALDLGKFMWQEGFQSKFKW
jgi:AcrR family transcriptional regulator